MSNEKTSKGCAIAIGVVAALALIIWIGTLSPGAAAFMTLAVIVIAVVLYKDSH